MKRKRKEYKSHISENFLIMKEYKSHISENFLAGGKKDHTSLNKPEFLDASLFKYV